MTTRWSASSSVRAVLRLTVFVVAASVATQIAQAQPVTVARGNFDPEERIDLLMRAHVGGKVETALANRAADTVIQQITIAPSRRTPWHTHPGPAVVVVTEGTLTIYDGDDPTCTGRSYGEGRVFVDLGQGHVHVAVNREGVPASVYVTYFDVPPDLESPLQSVEKDGFTPPCVLSQ